MATLKEVQSKIVSVKKTKQITSAMKMVATSRLRGSQNLMENFKPYALKFSQVLGSVAGKTGDSYNDPLLNPREEVKKIALVLCTSDRGLCGGFNINLIEKAKEFIRTKLSGKEASFVCFGKKGADWAGKTGIPVADQHLGVVGGNVEFMVASTAGQALINAFLNEEIDQAFVIYSQFESMAQQTPVVKQLLPIPSLEEAISEEEAQEGQQFLPEHICEPSAQELLGEMLPKNVFIQLYDALLQTSTSEHAARMRAMENATKACEDLVTELQTIFNKTRQASITAELMDIVGGVEALRG